MMARVVLASVLLVTFVFGQDNAPEVSQKDSVPTFQSKVNLVLVPVVVRDGRGRVVADLTKDDFQLFDKGKLQTIASFQTLKNMREVAAVGATAPAGASIVKTDEDDGVTAPVRYVAYLFDDLNSEQGDLMNLKAAATKHLTSSLQATDRAAIFSTSGQTSLEFTDDKVKLADTIAKLQVRPMFQHAGRQCPDISYYMADLIVNKNDPMALNVATQEAMACAGMTDASQASSAKLLAQSMAQQELSAGEQGTRVSLSVLQNLIRRMGSKPGQRLVVIASPGFLAVTSEARADETQILDLAASMKVMISAVNSRGLFTAMIDASQEGPSNLQSAPMIERYSRESAEATEDVLAELADGTGGTFFHNSNDLAGGLARVAAAPEVSYVLGFSPTLFKQDGSFHKLKISLVSHKDTSVQARRGYYAVKHGGDAQENAKADIEEAVFSRDEMSDIPVNLQTQFFKPDANSAKLTVVAKVDLRKLKFKKLDGRNRDDLTVVAVLFDRNGNYIKGTSKNVEMRLRDETLVRLTSGIAVKNNFDVGPGTYIVRLVVRDSEGQAMAAQNGAVEIP